GPGGAPTAPWRVWAEWPRPGRLRAAGTAPARTARGTARPTPPCGVSPGPHALPPAHQGLGRPPHRRRQDQDRDPALPQALHRRRSVPLLSSSASNTGLGPARQDVTMGLPDWDHNGFYHLLILRH